MDKASPTEAAEDTGSGELEENFRTIISSGVCAKSSDHIYSQMEYEHNFLENCIRYYCTTLYFFLFIYLLYKLFVIIFITCNLFFAVFFKIKKC